MSMNIGVSGLKAAQQELDVTGHNIANVDVVGFKSFRSMFADVYAESGGKMAQVSGVLTQGTSQRFNQGILQTTGSSLDMGIEGSGFFVLSGDGNTFYSRAGYFGLSRNDDLVNNQGFKVQGFQVDDKGEVVAGALGDIHIERKSIPARATSQISAAINLDARDSMIPAMVFDEHQPSSYNWATTFGLYDSLGVPHQLTLFTVLADSDSSTWDLFYRLDDQMLKDVSDPAHPVFRKDQLAFNGDGSIKSGGLVTLDGNDSKLSGLEPGGGALPLVLNLDLSSTTQFGQDYSIAAINQDGYTSGKMNAVQVDTGGLVQVLYSNGLKATQGQVALATFTNDNGLVATGNSSWQATRDAGDPTYTQSGTGGAGVINAQRLESSNVDLSSELVQLIVAQRNYQANARTLKAEDVVMQALLTV